MTKSILLTAAFGILSLGFATFGLIEAHSLARPAGAQKNPVAKRGLAKDDTLAKDTSLAKDNALDKGDGRLGVNGI
ncbi:MAG: hypothetical protein RIC55_14185 [Pirellulaceae bacterium]